MNTFVFWLGLLVVSAEILALGSQSSGREAQPMPAPILVNTCLISNNVERLLNFYEAVLGIKAQRSGDDYAEFRTGVGVLAVFSAQAQEKCIPGSAQTMLVSHSIRPVWTGVEA